MVASARVGENPRVPERVLTGPDAAAPAVYGYTIRGAPTLRFLRHGGGSQALEIVEVPESGEEELGEVLGIWALQGTTYRARARLSRTPVGYVYDTTDAGRFAIDLEQGRIEIPVTEDPILREQRLLGMPMILHFLSRGDISLHASAVEVGSSAIILAAPSKFGKTTLAFAFVQAGHRVLSEDMICLRPSTTEAIPGPALLRLRPDVYRPELPKGLFLAAERPDRFFIGFDKQRAGSSAPVPIRAIAFLREGEPIGVERADPVTSVKDLWALSFRIDSTEGHSDSFRHITKLVRSVPCWNVTRPKSFEALALTVEAIERLADR